MKKYPIIIGEPELKNRGVIAQSTQSLELLLYYTHLVFYEFIVCSSLKSLRLRLIEKHAEELEEDVKDILVNIAWGIDRSGDFVGLDDGIVHKTDESVEIKPLSERLITLVPTIVWSQIAALEPNIVFCGGSI